MPIDVPRSVERPAKPGWIKAKAPGSPEYMETRAVVKNLKLHTVCEEARCPNIGECWSHRTATFMIMGDYCSRKCHFCSVKKGTVEPGKENSFQPLDAFEPLRVGMAIAKLGLEHAVITTVDRDDIEDNGSAHFAQTIRAVHAQAPQCRVEVLIGDLRGRRQDLEPILSAGVEVLNHNMETVPRLYKKVRPFADYQRSLSVLAWSKELSPQTLTKSGIMVGLGEAKEEVFALMDDLRASKVDIMTIGQYLRPSATQMPVRAFVTPEEFAEYEQVGLQKRL